MFKKNQRHLQIPLTSHIDDLPEKLRKRLEGSWAGAFYQQFFCHLNEAPFAVLYADCPSRPNVPINVLVGLEYLKAGFGWTDEQLYDAFCFDIQVRYGLGYRQLGEGDFDLRSLYYFRERLSRYAQETGVNLLDQAFEQVTDAQLKAFQLDTRIQRMDSVQLASNIRKLGRLQLLVDVLQHVHRHLSPEDQARYTAELAPYLGQHPGHYVYRLQKSEMRTHMQRIGEVMQRLLVELASRYASQPVYQVLQRVFADHFTLQDQTMTLLPGKDLAATSLQSPDDREATFRQKRGTGHIGYVSNVSETCAAGNALQLVTKVQTAPNSTDDSQLLVEALPNLKQRMQLKTLYTDGGHGGPDADRLLQAEGVEHLQTAIRGCSPNPERLHLSDFVLHLDEQGQPGQITCPQGQAVCPRLTRRQKGWVATFDPIECSVCPWLGKCPTRTEKKKGQRRSLRFTQRDALLAIRRRFSQQLAQGGANPRAAVEATIRSVKHPFPTGKLPVRGRFRMACLVIGSAAMVNIRRIQRYLEGKKKGQQGEESPQEPSGDLLFLGWRAAQRGLRTLFSLPKPIFGC